MGLFQNPEKPMGAWPLISTGVGTNSLLAKHTAISVALSLG